MSKKTTGFALGIRAQRRPAAASFSGRFRLRPLARQMIETGLLAGSLMASQLLLAPLAYGAPQGGVVVQGQGSVTHVNSRDTHINQQSPNLLMNFDSFNLAKDESVRISQPGASSVFVGQILGGSATRIYGSINANGQIALVNPHGVIFGKTATINAAGVFASGLAVDTKKIFDDGKVNFKSVSGTGGYVINRGVIAASVGGSVGLLGESVTNEGVIMANLGHIHLASGSRAVVDFGPDRLIGIQVTDPALENSLGLKSAVSNSGKINAPGGTVMLTASVSKSLFDHAINNSGIVKAESAEYKNGVITLSGAGGSVLNTGTLDASSHGDDVKGGRIAITSDADTQIGGRSSVTTKSDAGKGGAISVNGDNVAIASGASLDASGANRGGQINIAATAVADVQAGAKLAADATAMGDGGAIDVRGDTVNVAGDLSVRGGPEGGDGGSVTLKASGSLAYDGSVDARAPRGKAGTLTLSSPDVTVSNDSSVTARSLARSEANIHIDASQGVTVDVLGGRQVDLPGNLNINVTGTAATFAMKGANDVLRTDGTVTIAVTDAGVNGNALIDIAGTIESRSVPGPLPNSPLNPGNSIALTATDGRIRVKSTGRLLARDDDSGDSGIILLTATGHKAQSEAGTVTFGGDADVSSAHGMGGTVKLLADGVDLIDRASINASGALGGGDVLVGGDAHGEGLGRNALRSHVGAGVNISADAVDQGEGGKVIVWSEEATKFYGSITARGGAQGGDGGFVETSGKQDLAFGGSVDTSAPGGAAGTLLLDPGTVVIDDTGTQDSQLSDHQILFADSGTANFSISAANIVSQLVNNDVLIQAQTSIEVSTDVNASATTHNLTLDSSTIGLDGVITLGSGADLSGTAYMVNVGAAGSIQNGIDVTSAAASSTQAAIINVASGTYTGDLSITKNYLTLQHTGTGTATITGVATNTQGDASAHATNILVDAHNVTLDHLTLQTPDVAAGQYAALVTLNGDNISLTNDTLVSLQNDVAPTGSNDGLTNILIQSMGAGDAPAGSVNGLTISANTFKSAAAGGKGYAGVYLNHQGQAVGTTLVDQVTISGNTFAGNIWRGVSTERSNVQIVDNEINPGAETLAAWGGSGVAVRDGDAAAIDGIVISGNSVGGTGTFAHDVLLGSAATDPLGNISIIGNVGNVYVDAQVDDASGVSWDTAGDITIAAGANISSGANLDLTASVGDIALGDGSLTATSGKVSLNATAGAITNGTGLVRANSVSLNAATGIGASGAALNVNSPQLSVDNSTSGDVYLADAAPVALSAIFRNQAPGGSLNLVTQGNLSTGTAAVSTNSGALTLAVDDPATGSDGNVSLSVGSGGLASGGGTITLQSADSISLGGAVNAGAGDVIVTADDDVNHREVFADNDGAVTGTGTITGASLTLNAASGIGATATEINAVASTVSAVNTMSGGIYLDNISSASVNFESIDAQTSGDVVLRANGATTLSSVSAINGSVSASADNGDLTAIAVTTHGSGDVSLTTTNLGNVLVGDVQAAGHSASLVSAGRIDETTPGVSNAAISAGAISLQADTGIGVAGALQVTGSSISLAGGSGDIAVSSLAAAAVTLTSATTSGANIQFDQTGGHALTVSALQTNTSGDVSVTNAGGNLNVSQLASAGGVTLATTGFGSSVSLGSITATEGDVTIDSAGTITDAQIGETSVGITNVTSQQLAMSATSIGAPGTSGTIETNVGTLTTDTSDTNGYQYINESNGVILGLMNAGSATIDLTVAGSIVDTMGADTTPDVIAGTLNLTGSTGIGASVADALNIKVDELSITGGSGKAYIADAGGLAADLLDQGAGNLTLAMGGPLTDNNGAINNVVAGTLTITGGKAVTGLNTRISDLALNTGAASITDSSGLNLLASTVGGALTLNTTGAITQSGGLVVTGTASINAGSGAITLKSGNNDFEGRVSVTGAVTQLADANGLSFGTVNTGGLTIANSGALDLGTGTVNGGLIAISNNGAIFQTGPLTVTGAADFNAGTGAVTLTQTANDFQGAVSMTGATTQVAARNALTLDQINAGNLTVTGNDALVLGNLTVAGLLSVTATGIDVNGAISASGVQFDATRGDLTESGAGRLTVSGASELTVSDSYAMTLSGGNDLNTVMLAGGSGMVTLQDTNDITLGAATLGGLVVTAPGKVLVNGALTTTAGGIFFNSAAELNVNAALTSATGITASNVAKIYLQPLVITAQNGDINLAGVGTVGSMAILGSGLVDLEARGAGSIFIPNVVDAADGLTTNLRLNAQGAVKAGSVDLDGGPSADGNLTVQFDSNDNDVAAFTVDGNIKNVSGLSISGSAARNDSIIVNGSISTASGDILLQNALTVTLDGNVDAAGQLAVSHAGTVNLLAGRFYTTHGGHFNLGQNVGSINISGSGNTLIDTTHGGVSPAGGSIELGPIVGSGAASLTVNGGTGGAVAFNGAVNVAGLTIGNSNGVVFANTVGAVTPGALTIVDTAAGKDILFQGNAHITTLTTSAQDYSLSFVGATNEIDNPVTFQNGGTLTLGNGTGDRFEFTGGVNAGAADTRIGGKVSTVNAPLTLGDLTVVDGSNATLSTAGGNVTIGRVTGVDNTVGGGTDAGPESLTVDAGTGNIILNDISGAANALTRVTVAAASDVNYGAVTLPGQLNQLSTSGTTRFAGAVSVANMTLAGAAFLLDDGVNASGRIQVTNSGAFTVANGAAVIAGDGFSASGPVTLSAGITTTATPVSIGGNLTIADNKDVSVSTGGGDFTVSGVTRGTGGGGDERLTVDAGAGNVTFGDISGSGTTGLTNVTLTHANVTHFGSISMNGSLVQSARATGDTTFNASASLASADLKGTSFVFGDFSTTGPLTVDASQGVSQSAGTRLTVSGLMTVIANDLSLAALSSSGGVNLAVAGNATLQNDQDLSLSGSVGGDLSVSTSGAISLIPSGSLYLGGDSSFAGNSLALPVLSAAGNITLNINRDAALANSQGMSLQGHVGGDLSAASSAGSIVDGGDLTISGAASFTADGVNGGIALDGAGDQFGSLQLTSRPGSVTVNDAGDTHLVAVSANAFSLTSAGKITDGAGAIISVTGPAVIRARGDISLGDVAASSLDLSSATGNISQHTAAEWNIAGDVSVAANASTGVIDLSRGTNHLGNLGLTAYDASVSEEGPISLRSIDVNSLKLDSTGSAAGIADGQGSTVLVSGAAGLSASGGDITLGTGSNSLVNFGTIELSGADARVVESSSMRVAGLSITGDVNLAAQTSMTDEPGAILDVDGRATLAVSGSTRALTLDGSNNRFGSMSLAGNDVTVNLSADSRLADILAKNLTLTVNGDLTVGESSPGQAVEVDMQADLNAENVIFAAGSNNSLAGLNVTTSTSGSVDIQSSITPDLNGVNSTNPSGMVSINSPRVSIGVDGGAVSIVTKGSAVGGSISVGGVDAGGAQNPSTGAITLIGDVTMDTTNGVVNAPGANITLVSGPAGGGSISAENAAKHAGLTLVAGSNGVVDLGNFLQGSPINALHVNSASLVKLDDLYASGNTIAINSSGDINASQIVSDALGNITFNAGGEINLHNTINAVKGAVQLTSGGTINSQNISVARGVTIDAQGNVAISGTTSAGDNVTISSATGSVLASGGITSTDGNVTLQAMGPVSLTPANTANAAAVAISAGGDVSLVSTSGTVASTAEITGLSGVGIAANGDVTLSSSAASSPAVFSGDDAVILSSQGNLNLNGDVNVAGDFKALSVAGRISQQKNSTVTSTGGAVTLSALSGLKIATVNAASDVTLVLTQATPNVDGTTPVFERVNDQPANGDINPDIRSTTGEISFVSPQADVGTANDPFVQRAESPTGGIFYGLLNGKEYSVDIGNSQQLYAAPGGLDLNLENLLSPDVLSLGSSVDPLTFDTFASNYVGDLDASMNSTAQLGQTAAQSSTRTTAASSRSDEDEVASVDETAFQNLKNYDENPNGILLPEDQRYAYDTGGDVHLQTPMRITESSANKNAEREPSPQHKRHHRP